MKSINIVLRQEKITLNEKIVRKFLYIEISSQNIVVILFWTFLCL